MKTTISTVLSLGLLAAPVISKTLDSKLAKNVLESKGQGYCSPSGPIENTLCAYETIETLNEDLFPALDRLVQGDFFRHYKVDLYRECPFWYENGFCMNRACGVETADESDVPEKWRTQALSQVTPLSSDPSDPLYSSSSIPGCSLHAQDFCYTDSDTTSTGSYVDLIQNPERFTGYAGESAHRVWGAIYEENCFGLGEGGVLVGGGGGASGGDSGVVGGGVWGESVKKNELMGGLSEPKGLIREKDQECVEKRTFYRIISGLHASISIHICHDYLDQATGEWKPDLNCFINRVASHPERLSHVYFNTVLLLRAIAHASPWLETYDITTCRGPEDVVGRERDVVALRSFERVIEMAKKSGEGAFDEKGLFRGPDARELRDQFKHNFRNVSTILDCIGCDKCRLWGKLQVSGLGTALKILFELDGEAFDPKKNPNLLQRSEIVALFNTLHRMSESLAAVETFRKMYAETQVIEREKAERVVAKMAESTSTDRRATKKPKIRKGLASSKERLHQAGEKSSLIALAWDWIGIFRVSCRQSWSRCLGQVSRLMSGGGGGVGGEGKEEL